ncbi:MAG: ArsB/NhaD family transporter [Acidobacteria bacterium]|nr:ArsB/NhaD family transporter [Acidobacteriota bacterium]
MDATETIATSHVVFGWNPAIVACLLFVLVYVLIVTEKINRAIAGLLGAGLMIFCGVVNQEMAIRSVDFNTLGLLLGMMLIVGITGESGAFQYVAIWSAKIVGARPMGVLVMLCIVTAILSALLDNVTTVLLVVPMTLLITEELKVRPYPYLVYEVMFSNIGGTATLIGDPPNIMIGSAVGPTFNQFVTNLAPVVVVIMIGTMIPACLIWRKDLITTEEARQRVMKFNEIDAIKDWRLLKQSLSVLAIVLAGFVTARLLHLEPATIAMFGAALLFFLHNYRREADEQTQNIHKAFNEVERVTLMFFVGLFILVHGLESTGVIRAMADKLLSATGGELHTTTLVILWSSAVLSAFIDNIPFVATMIPMIKSMAPTMGGEQGIMPLWWALSLGACLGGNGTLIGASANHVVAGIAERAGQPIRFWAYFKSAFLLMLLSMVVCYLYLMARYL